MIYLQLRHVVSQARSIACWIIVLLPGVASTAHSSEPLDCLIEPHRLIAITSSEIGVLASVNVNEADVVGEGETIAALRTDVENAVLEVSRARADAKWEIELLRREHEFTVRNRDRVNELNEKHVVSVQNVDEVRTAQDAAWLRLQSALERQQTAQLEAARDELALARRIVRSPIDGVVTKKYKNAGEYIDGDAIVQLAQLDPLRVSVVVPMSMFDQIQVGMQATVLPELSIAGPFVATVTSIDPMMDAATATLSVRLSLPNPQHRLPAGLKCSLVLHPLEDVNSAAPVAQSGRESVTPVVQGAAEPVTQVVQSDTESAEPVLQSAEESTVSVEQSAEEPAVAVEQGAEEPAVSVEKSAEEPAVSVEQSAEEPAVAVEQGAEEPAVSVEQGAAESTAPVANRAVEEDVVVDLEFKHTIPNAGIPPQIGAAMNDKAFEEVLPVRLLEESSDTLSTRISHGGEVSESAVNNLPDQSQIVDQSKVLEQTPIDSNTCLALGPVRDEEVAKSVAALLNGGDVEFMRRYAEAHITDGPWTVMSQDAHDNSQALSAILAQAEVEDFHWLRNGPWARHMSYGHFSRYKNALNRLKRMQALGFSAQLVAAKGSAKLSLWLDLPAVITSKERSAVMVEVRERFPDLDLHYIACTKLASR